MNRRNFIKLIPAAALAPAIPEAASSPYIYGNPMEIACEMVERYERSQVRHFTAVVRGFRLDIHQLSSAVLRMDGTSDTMTVDLVEVGDDPDKATWTKAVSEAWGDDT